MKLFLGTILIVFPFFAFGAIYKIIDANGNVFYTDQPSDNAKPVNLDTASVVPEPASNSKTGKKNNDIKTADDAVKKYEELKIIEPTDQATLWNQNEVPVVLNIQPELFKGDKVALFLDGKKLIEEATTKFSLNRPERGQHSVQAKILGTGGQVKKESNTVTIFVHYGTVNQQGG